MTQEIQLQRHGLATRTPDFKRLPYMHKGNIVKSYYQVIDIQSIIRFRHGTNPNGDFARTHYDADIWLFSSN